MSALAVSVHELGSLGELVTGIATLVLAVTAALTVLGAKGSFTAQARESRGRWLAELHTRFTTEPSFQSVRQQLYNRERSELNETLVRAREWEAGETDQPLPDADCRLLVELDDYLDFFALIWKLIDNHQLAQDDAYRLFSWYLLDAFEVGTVEAEITRSYAPVVKLHRTFDEMQAKQALARG